MNVRPQRAQNVWLMQMVGRRNYYCVNAIRLEQLFHVRVHVRNGKSLRERAGFYTVIVTNCDKSRTLDF